MKTMISLMLIICAVTAFAAAPTGGGIDYEWNLAQVPESDPSAGRTPAIPGELKGVHPRILFTSEELAELKTATRSDKLLKRTADDIIAWSRRNLELPSNTPDICRRDTPALTVSFGRYVKLAYAYGLTGGDPAVKANIIGVLEMMLREPHWAHSMELDCNMGAANNMFMVGALFDTVYNDLDPDFREAMAEKILTHIRRMHWLGHKQKAQQKIKYWQQDPQPNHRWHRNAGMTACLLAIADMPQMKGRTGYLMKELKKEVEFILEWYPHDGDCHEGAGYQQFGFFYLGVTAQIWDRVMGTGYLNHPGFSNAWKMQLHYWAPGRQSYMSFGDAPNTNKHLGNLGMAFFLSSRINRNRDVHAALMNYYNKCAESRTGWALLATCDPTVGKGDYTKITPHYLFADLGAAAMRDHWDDDAVLFTFKCGPYGGYRLNEYRHEHRTDKGKPHYVNLAHDDPDANSFALGTAGEFLFHPGRYAKIKKSENHSTLIVDGKGQHQEGQAYTQPDPDNDMRDFSYLTGWKADEKSNRIIVEGEAGNAYPELKHFRRSCIWMPGEYILILDNVRTLNGRDRNISWQAVTPGAQLDSDTGNGRCFVETESGHRMYMQMLSNRETEAAIDALTLTGRWGRENVKALRFTKETDSIKYACLLDPWKKTVSMTFTESGSTVTIAVKGDGIRDIWKWKAASNRKTPSAIRGTRNGTTLIALTAADKAPGGD